MGYYVIIRGPLECGKTTISKKLAQILKAEYFSVDKVLEENGLEKELEGGVYFKTKLQKGESTACSTGAKNFEQRKNCRL